MPLLMTDYPCLGNCMNTMDLLKLLLTHSFYSLRSLIHSLKKSIMTQLSFISGPFYMTAGVSSVMERDRRFAEFIHHSIKRHLNCDFGDIDPEDKGCNEQAIIDGGRIFSVYKSNTSIEEDPTKI